MKITNWNGRPKIEAKLLSPEGKLPTENYTPRGNGRNYGDAGLNTTILDMPTFRKVLKLEGEILHVSAGYTLTEILNYIVPKGFLMPVIPGTQHVTVGGMIAADIHGKNHVSKGTIGQWTSSIEIMLPDGAIKHCSNSENSELFQTTIGGMGLTGTILSAKFILIRLESDHFKQNVIDCPNLESLLSTLKNSTSEYTAGWFDCYSMKRFLCIQHHPELKAKSEAFQLKKPRLKIPFASLPFVQSFVMKWYNKRYAKKTLSAHKKVVGIEDVFFPLDKIKNWNYLYGKRGFYQLQFTLPEENILPKMETLMKRIQASGYIPTLVVVKRHGEQKSPGILSYPTPGFSFAFDFRYQKGLEEFLRETNDWVTEVDGRIYLVKDALLTPENFEKMYPESQQFKKTIEQFNQGRITSLLSKRLNLTP